ncbi:hypothetical protein [Arthrobacter sp. zg-Y1110]|uniref:hypothetical protein n=1 Tax=Arthrobacter sp. zg-Y1110 TaxID=2886932 RepID=UPI001D143819|nr:hypothetical protein [Arthrobacter sp. zg-Y1110]MCC3291795.1 hypothetical protein [Arthrobacter sp. zg-Y1110]UWX85627.1 hypothetical protein N2K99_03490 [Arthrobacter sp. zg-Y1110]
MEWIWNVLWPILLIGFGAGWLTKRSLDRRHESRALNELVTYLHLKRTLAPIDPQPAQGGPMEARHRSAVQDLRENVMETLAHLTPGSGATEVLMRMSAASNRYLRDVAADPGSYQFALMELRRNLDEDLRILTDGRRDVQYLSPGEASTCKRPPPSSSGTSRPSSGTTGPGGRTRTRR